MKFLLNSRSKKFLLFLISFLIGVFVAKGLFVSFEALFLGSLGLLGLSIIYYKTNLIYLNLTLLFILLGIFYFSLFSRTDTFEFANTETGIIVDDPTLKSGSQSFTLKTENQKKILVYTKNFPEFSYGDKLNINGKIDKPTSFNGFDYEAYLARYGITGIARFPTIEKIESDKGNLFLKHIYLTKEKFVEKISRSTPEPEASLASAILIGARKSLPEGVVNDFKTTGLTHIIAISGYNIAIIVSASWLIFRRFGRKGSFFINLGFIGVFIVLTGLSSSVVRGALAAILILLAKYFGRRANPTILIALCAFLMALVNVYVLRVDVGFELSFLAFAGLMYLSPVLKPKLNLLKLPDWLGTILSETLSAQIFALPLLIVLFGQISLISLAANVLVLPLIPLAMAIGFTQGIIGLIFLPLAQVLGWINYLFLHYIIEASHFLAGVPLASINFKFSPLWLLLYYPLLIYIIYLQTKKTNENKI